MDISIPIIIITIIYILYQNDFFGKCYTHTKIPLSVSCNSNDISCKMYNHRDIFAKCNYLCINKYPNSIYNEDTHSIKNNIHSCQCKLIDEFTSIKNYDTPILGKTINNDTNNRDNIEKIQYDRLDSLIFG